MPPTRAAVVGLGVMGRVAVTALDRSPAWTVVAAADPTAAARAQVGAVDPAIELFADAAELVDSHHLDRLDVDVVVIATPPDLHAELAIAALRAGRHVLCEKPMARTVDEADAMVAASSGAVAVVDHQLRYNRARTWIRNQVLAGSIGTPRHVRSVACFPGLRTTPWTWWSSLALGGGLLNEYGSHTVDLLHWWFGPSDAAAGVVRTVVGERVDAAGRSRTVDSDDVASFRLQWDGGLFADVLLSGASHRAERSIVVVGDEGEIVLDEHDTVTVHSAGGHAHVVELREVDASLIGDASETYTQPFARLVEELAAHVDDRSRPFRATTFEQGRRIIATLEAVRASSAASSEPQEAAG